MSKSEFSATEWEALLNAPHLAYRAIALSEKDGLLTRRKEAKALASYLKKYTTGNAVVKEILEEQDNASDELSGSYSDVKRALSSIGDSLSGKEDASAIRDFLTGVATAVAEAAKEERRGDAITDNEQKALDMIASELKGKAKPAAKAKVAAGGIAGAVGAKVAAAKAKAAAQAKEKSKIADAVEKARAEERAKAKAKDEAEDRRDAASAKAKAKRAEAAAKAKAKDEAEDRREAASAKAKAKREEAAAKEANAKAVAKAKWEKEEAAKAAAKVKWEKEQAEKAAAVKTYVIQSGDSLSAIALKFYGDANRWGDIAAANKDVIPNPNLIHPGQEIKIP